MQFYDASNWSEIFNFSDIGKEFVSAIVNDDKASYLRIAEGVLGGDIDLDVDSLRHELIAKIDEIEHPFFHASGATGFVRSIVDQLCLLTGRTGLFTYRPLALFRKRLFRDEKLLHIKINEIDAWLNGLNQDNFNSELVSTDKGNGRWPGYGV